MNAQRYLCRGALVALASGLGVVASAAEPAAPDSDSGHPGKISPQIREAVSAVVPHYAPAPPAKIAESPRQPGGRASPADDVLQLPTIEVRTPKNLPSTEYDWLTRKGRIALAVKKFAGLGVGNFFGLNSGIGLAMLEEERQLEVKAALVEQADRGADNSPEARRIKRLVQAAIQRPNTAWATARGGKSGGP